MLTENHVEMFGRKLTEVNTILNRSDGRSGKPFHALATSLITDYHFTGDTISIPRYCFLPTNERIDNITDWALAQFRERYASEGVTAGQG